MSRYTFLGAIAGVALLYSGPAEAGSASALRQTRLENACPTADTQDAKYTGWDKMEGCPSTLWAETCFKSDACQQEQKACWQKINDYNKEVDRYNSWLIKKKKECGTDKHTASNSNHSSGRPPVKPLGGADQSVDASGNKQNKQAQSKTAEASATKRLETQYCQIDQGNVASQHACWARECTQSRDPIYHSACTAACTFKGLACNEARLGDEASASKNINTALNFSRIAQNRLVTLAQQNAAAQRQQAAQQNYNNSSSDDDADVAAVAGAVGSIIGAYGRAGGGTTYSAPAARPAPAPVYRGGGSNSNCSGPGCAVR